MKIWSAIITFLLLGFFLNAQVTVSGIITDKTGTPVIGANISIKGTYDGASSDLNGNFSFITQEKGEQVIAVSYVGYKSYEDSITIDSDSLELTILLEEIVNELNSVVITAGSFEASDEKKAVILKPVDIVTTAGATADIAGALNTLPGTQRVGEEGQLFVRGGAASETRTFIDGLFVQNPYNSTVPDIPARGRFSPFLFKGTMFSTGGYSAEYGQALSSALILNTRDLAPQTVTGISLMSLGFGLSHTQRWDNTSLEVSGNYTNLAPYISMVPQNMDWEKPFQGAGGQMVFRQKTSKTGMFKLMANGEKGWFEFNHPNVNSENLEMSSLALTNDNYYVNTSFREIIGKKWSVFVGGAYTYNKDHIKEAFRLDAIEQSGQFKTTFTNQVNDRVKLKFGGEYLKNDFDENYRNPVGAQFTTDLKEDYLAGFAETDIILSKKFVTRIGGRLEYSKLLNEWNIAPRFSMAYKTGENSQVSFAFGQFFQNPVNDVLRYNEEVDFERADHYVLNYQITKNRRTFRVEGYYKSYQNLVTYDAAQPWLSNNNGDGFARGVDFFYRDQKTIQYGDFWISYSFLDTERLFRDFPERSTPRFASKHNLSVVYKHWVPGINTSIGATYAFSSGRPYNNPNSLIFNGERSSNFHDLSLNVSYLTNIFGNFTIFYAAINNIPGFENTFGQRFSNVPDENGQYASYNIQQNARRFFFVGIFYSLGQRFDSSSN